MSKMNYKSITLLAATLLLTLPAFAQHYTRTDLTADVAATSPNPVIPDPNLVNAWGLTRSSTSPWWIADNGTGLSTLYNGVGAPQQLVVTIPLPGGASGASAPTGTAFNYTSVFNVANGQKAIFLFVTEDGTISGWNPNADATHAIIKVKHPTTAIYKGVAIADADKRSPSVCHKLPVGPCRGLRRQLQSRAHRGVGFPRPASQEGFRTLQHSERRRQPARDFRQPREG